MKFSERLSSIRKSRNLTQADLAQMVGMTARTIQNYESDAQDTIPNQKTRKKLADALQVDEMALLNDEAFAAYQEPFNDALSHINLGIQKIQRAQTVSPKQVTMVGGAAAVLALMGGAASAAGAVLSIPIADAIYRGQRQIGKKKMFQYFSNLQQRCYIEISNCRNIILEKRELYKRKLEIRDSSGQSNYDIGIIIDLIFAIQDCMFIWYEQSMYFRECIRILRDSKVEEADQKIQEYIKEIKFRDKEKGELQKRIRQLEEKLKTAE